MAVKNPEKTILEETKSGYFWVGFLDKDNYYLGPPKRGHTAKGQMDWKKDLIKFSVYRKLVSGDWKTKNNYQVYL